MFLSYMCVYSRQPKLCKNPELKRRESQTDWHRIGTCITRFLPLAMMISDGPIIGLSGPKLGAIKATHDIASPSYLLSVIKLALYIRCFNQFDLAPLVIGSNNTGAILLSSKRPEVRAENPDRKSRDISNRQQHVRVMWRRDVERVYPDCSASGCANAE